MIDYRVILVSFPNGKVHECITPNDDGSYTIFIDARLPQEGQKKRLLHALKHILGNDFEKYDVNEIERYAHNQEFAGELILI